MCEMPDQFGTTTANAPDYQGLDDSLVLPILREVKRALSSVHKDTISVLEAGGGSTTLLRDFDRRVEFTTIDVSPEQIERNNYAKTKILGDLQVYDYGERRFDLIICWDVLEHLAEPAEAIRRMAAAASRNCVFLVKGPLPNSLKGLITRWTPHKLHVLYYRSVLGSSTAGLPGFAPFPTQLCGEADPRPIERVLGDQGFVTVARHSFITDQTLRLKQRLPLVHAAYKTVASVMSGLTRGAYGRYESDFCIIAQRHASTGVDPPSSSSA
jgi:Methyltransferase domain